MGYAEDKTEEELIGLERAITREYRQAYKSVQMKAAKYFGIFEERDKKMREALKDGTYPKLEGASAWMTPEEHYKQWRLAQIGRGKRWEAVRDDLADSITKTNEMAANIVNRKTAGIFGFNHNFSAYEIEKKVGKGVAFNIYNEHAVKELLEGKNHTEFRVLRVNRKRDYTWNQHKIQAALTSGILQGQSVPELTDAFLGVMGSNRNAAIRNARTAVTSAQNAGVIESCKKLQEMGIEVLLQWRSAHDGRVRDSHAHLDGVRIKPGERFPNGCRYPGDPQGRGREVYNCRCTLIKILPKYNGDTIESKNTEADYKAWLEGKKAESTITPQQEAVSKQIELLKKYGNLSNIMINGTTDDMVKWAELQKLSNKSEKELLSEMSKSADNWETVMNMQSETTMNSFANQLLDVATDAELSALNLWSGETYANINRYLRFGINVDDISKNAAKNIESVLNKITTTEEIIVHRGTGTKHIFEKMKGDWKSDPMVLVGQEFSDSGFVATSPLKEGGFSGIGQSQAELFIKVPKGTHGAYIAHEAHNELEKEFLLQKGYLYRIIKAEYRDNKLFPDEKDLKVWCEVVLNE